MKQVFFSLTLILLATLPISAQNNSWQKRGFSVESDTVINFTYPPSNLFALSIETRCAIKEKNNKKYKNCSFGIYWPLPDNRTCKVSVHDISGKSSDFIGQNEVEIRVTILSDTDSTVLISKLFKKNVSTDGGANSIQVSFFNDSGAKIKLGNSFLSNQVEIPEEYSRIPGTAYLFVNGKARVLITSAQWSIDKPNELRTKWNLASIKELITDEIGDNALWKYLDRETDTRYTRLGGIYNFATVKEDDGTISIIYISGAKTNNSIWQVGMQKGRLTKNLLVNDYDLKWYDADMNLLENECHATMSDDRKILTLYFPLLKSTLRFIRMPKDM